MYAKILMAPIAAALVLGSVSIGSADEYNDLEKNSGVVAYQNGGPVQYPQARQTRGHNTRAEAINGRHDAVAPFAAGDQGVLGQTWPGQW